MTASTRSAHRDEAAAALAPEPAARGRIRRAVPLRARVRRALARRPAQPGTDPRARRRPLDEALLPPGARARLRHERIPLHAQDESLRPPRSRVDRRRDRRPAQSALRRRLLRDGGWRRGRRFDPDASGSLDEGDGLAARGLQFRDARHRAGAVRPDPRGRTAHRGEGAQRAARGLRRQRFRAGRGRAGGSAAAGFRRTAELMPHSALLDFLRMRVSHSSRLVGWMLQLDDWLGIRLYNTSSSYIFLRNPPREQTETFERLLAKVGEIHEICVRNGRELYVVVFPNKIQVENHESLSTSVYDAERPNRRIAEYCASLGLRCFDQLAVLSDSFKRDGRPLYFAVDRHLNSSGPDRRRVDRRLARAHARAGAGSARAAGERERGSRIQRNARPRARALLTQTRAMHSRLRTRLHSASRARRSRSCSRSPRSRGRCASITGSRSGASSTRFPRSRHAR